MTAETHCRDRTREGWARDCECTPFQWPYTPPVGEQCISNVMFPDSAFGSDFSCAFGSDDTGVPPADCISQLPSSFSTDFSCAFGYEPGPGEPPIDPPPTYCRAELPNNFDVAFSCGFGVGNDPNPDVPPDPDLPPDPGDTDDSECQNAINSHWSCAFGSDFGEGTLYDSDRIPEGCPQYYEENVTVFGAYVSGLFDLKYFVEVDGVELVDESGAGGIYPWPIPPKQWTAPDGSIYLRGDMVRSKLGSTQYAVRGSNAAKTVCMTSRSPVFVEVINVLGTGDRGNGQHYISGINTNGEVHKYTVVGTVTTDGEYDQVYGKKGEDWYYIYGPDGTKLYSADIKPYVETGHIWHIIWDEETRKFIVELFEDPA